MFIFVPAVSADAIELERGTDRLLLETGDLLVLESSGAASAAAGFEIVDARPTYPIEYRHWMESVFFQPEPSTLFESAWLPGMGQQEPAALMPVYNERQIFGDIANIAYSTLQLFANVHFGPDGTDAFKGPSTFDILEGDADFEIRTPE
jgi:hypothetical protein